MDRKQNSDQQQYPMTYYAGGVGAPAGYAVAVADRPGLYAASPYVQVPSPYMTGQASLAPSMQQYAAVRQQYAMVTQPSPYPTSQHAAAAFYASPAAACYTNPTAVPLSSLQTMSSSSAQLPYMGAQYDPRLGVQAAVMRPTSTNVYRGSSLYAMSAYNGVPAVSAQPGRAPYAMGPVAFAASASQQPSSSNPAYPGVGTFEASPY